MNKKGLVGLLMTALALGGVSQSWGGGIYRWVDEQGVTHFGEKPPSPGVGEKIKVNAPSPSSGGAEATQKREEERAKRAQAEQEKTASESTANQQAQAVKAQAEAIKKSCEVYAANLKILKAHGQIKESAPDGQIKMLKDEEKQARVKEAEKFIAENCQSQKKP